MIVGTAGHIDHGKTALVRALTGVDTDRLPEEKRRGITIELGFAPLALDGLGTVGVVDVPGHEAFVRTMVAGATGIDAALLVIAADEGVMPQTREHLAILELLGVRRGVVALTKVDLVDPDWLELVVEDVRAEVARALPEAEIVATSSVTGQGIDDLRDRLAEVLRASAPRIDDDLFRLPVDRAFTIKGTGTVVTGTVWSGMLDRDANVRIMPAGRSARVRGVQSHGAQVDRIRPGARAAIALAGVEVADVPRGSTVITSAAWHPTTVVRADVTLTGDAAAHVRPRTWLRFHTGTSEVGARVVARRVLPDQTFGARIVLDEPVLLRAGDRFVLRTSAPLNTIGGGVVTDPYAPRRARPWEPGSSSDERLERLVAEGGGEGIELETLPVRLGLAPRACNDLVADAGDRYVRCGRRLVGRELFERVQSELVGAVEQHHAVARLEPGLPQSALRSRAHASPEVVDEALAVLLARGRLSTSSGIVAVGGWEPNPDKDDQAVMERVLARLVAAGAEPPTAAEVEAEVGGEVVGVLRFLERRGDIVQVEPNRYYAASELKLVLDKLRGAMAGGAVVGPSELRDLLGLSRKFLIPILEYCDRAGYTNRNATGRVWNGT
jgi:selenocysteine-specific elongation factor